MPVAALIALAVIVFVGWRFLMEGDPFRAAIARFHVDRLEAAANAGGHPMVMVGGSHLKYAMMTESEGFSEVAATAALSNPALIRITGPGGIETIDAPFIEALVRLQPSVVLLQDHVLNYRLPEVSGAEFARHCRERLLAVLKGRGDGLRKYRNLERLDELRGDAQEAVIEDHLASARRERSKRFVPGMRKDVLRLLEACRVANIRVVVVNVPIHRQSMVFADHHAEEVAGIQRLVDRGECEALTCSLTFEAEEYRDLKHMLKPARRRYTTWLLSSLASLEPR